MMIIALILRPIILLTQVPGQLVTRILADDLIIAVIGDHHLVLDKFAIAMRYISDLGSKVSLKKSLLFSTVADFRNHLRNYHWPVVGGCMRVLMDFRDLGAHLNLSVKHTGTTLTTRIAKGVRKLARIRWLPHALKQKARLVVAAVHRGALYGCEAVHASEDMVRRYSAATARALGPPSA